AGGDPSAGVPELAVSVRLLHRVALRLPGLGRDVPLLPPAVPVVRAARLRRHADSFDRAAAVWGAGARPRVAMLPARRALAVAHAAAAPDPRRAGPVHVDAPVP